MKLMDGGILVLVCLVFLGMGLLIGYQHKAYKDCIYKKSHGRYAVSVEKAKELCQNMKVR